MADLISGVREAAAGGGVTRPCDRCENATPARILVVKNRMIHQKVTGQKDGNYPGEVKNEDEGTVFSGGVKILQGFISYSGSVKRSCDSESVFIVLIICFLAERRWKPTAFGMAPATTPKVPEQIKTITRLQKLPTEIMKAAETPL